jgi:hypothetical protein
MNNAQTEHSQILDVFPEIINGKEKTALYVGANRSRAFFLDALWSFGYEVDIIEIYKENFDFIKNNYKFRNLIFGDIQSCELEEYDLIFWYHGPEHIEKENFQVTLERLEEKANDIVLGCPKNDHHIYEKDPNIFEKHLWKICEEDFVSLGYCVEVRKREKAVDNIVAYKNCRIS